MAAAMTAPQNHAEERTRHTEAQTLAEQRAPQFAARHAECPQQRQRTAAAQHGEGLR